MHTSETRLSITPQYGQFIGFDNPLPPVIDRKREKFSAEYFGSLDKLAEKFRGQPEMTSTQIEETARAILNNQTFKNLFDNAIPNKNFMLTQLALRLNNLLRIMGPYFKKNAIYFPQQNPSVIELVTKLFTHTLTINSQELYQLLGKAEMYGAFHRFCTQSVPEGLKYNFATFTPAEKTDNKLLPHVLRRILPKGIRTGLVEIDSSHFSKEKKWIANDRETRIKLAHEMREYLIEYIQSHPNQEVSIIEPGGGNAEFSVILAQLLEENEATKRKVNIIIKEFSSQMAQEGKDKIAQITHEKMLQGRPQPNYKIHYVGGSAVTPLADQITMISQLVKSGDQVQLQNEFFLTMSEAQKLLLECNNTPVVAAVSTYTFGAMAKHAVPIVEQTQRDVIKDGLLLFCDFAERPPYEYSHSPLHTPEEQTELAALIKTYDDFSRLGLIHGLATNYKLWEHDVMQVWNVYTQLAKQSQNIDTTSHVSSTIDLKPFAFLPLKKRGDKITTLVIPGYFEMIIRAQGTGKSDTLITI